MMDRSTARIAAHRWPKLEVPAGRRGIQTEGFGSRDDTLVRSVSQQRASLVEPTRDVLGATARPPRCKTQAGWFY